MADAAVEFLLENLKQLLLYHGHLISDAKNLVEKLAADLRIFKTFLRGTTKKLRKDGTLQELISQIRDVVYEAEDIIDSFVTQAAVNKSKNYLLRAFKTPVQLHDIAKRVSAVSQKVERTRTNYLSMLNAEEGDREDSEVPELRRVNVVGFEDEAAKLKGYLSENTKNLDVISVIGMPGLGKTTLAGMIFHDEEIKFKFSIRIWVYVSAELKRKDVFLAILKELTTLTDDILYHTSEQDLANLVATELDASGKFLIVMDDVWTASDWDKLKIALPRNNNMGKILITSRQEEVGLRANCNRPPHKLRLLTHDESCLLLCLEALGKREFPEELKVHGDLIATRCGGLPLAIVVIGGILVKKTNAWERVSKSVPEYLKDEDSEKRMDKIISMSYDKLPYHLRACFLHLGSMFPEDSEIPVWKLIRMWIAEGFIQQKQSINMEETAQNYLEEIINRNLVRIEKMSHDGRVKSCRIHDMLRDFCKNKAKPEEENFLQEIKLSSEGGFEPPVLSEEEKHRRLCIHSNVLKFLSSKPAPYGPRVRSFACFSNEDFTLPTENNSSITAAFKLLRVLDVKPIKFTKLPSDLYDLIHLKYIHIFFELNKLPQAFNKLWNIQTLIVNTTSRTLEIKADIWQMIHLRHLKTNASTTLPKTGKNSKGGEKLQTLGTISPQSCTEEVFNRACNLKKLGIRGRLSSLLDGKNGSFDSLGKLNNLEKLKLLNDAFPSASSEGKLDSLPPPYKFPPHLRSLTLSETFLDWCYMSTIGSLDNLKVLKLKENAFMGECWQAANGGFSLLEVLHIGRTDLAVWEASWDNFPKLKVLELHNCEKLRKIPIRFADIPNLLSLNLYRSKHATASAKKIEKAKKEKLAEGTGFKLSIFPPEE